MRLKFIKVITVLLLVLTGLAMLLLAIYAYELKLDNNPVMGSQRKVLALAGAACLALATGFLVSRRIHDLFKTRALQRLEAGLERAGDFASRLPAMNWLRDAQQRVRASVPGRWLARHPEVWAILGALLVISTSYWFITSGRWVWQPYKHYYDRQADAFLAGSLALLEAPPAPLIALAEPYDFRNRTDIEYIWDASFYQGKYYLYWGPVPAVLAAAIKLIRPGRLEDQHLIMFFLTGMALVMAALLHWLRKTFFPISPAWTLLPLTMTAGLCAPVLWLVERPSVYEAAIAGGAFFLLLGLYAALRGMVSRPGNGWLALAGLAWGASVGCRLNHAAAVIWLAGVLGLYLIQRERGTWGWVLPALCLGLPLLASATGLGWYNLARFGSIFETGHRYQLTGPSLPADYSLTLSGGYMLPNLYNYLFRPLVYTWTDFPFVFAPYIRETMWPWFIRLPAHYYYSEPVAGIFSAIPFFWLIALPVLRPLRAGWDWAHERISAPAVPAQPLIKWVWWLTGGAALISLGFLSLFISSIMRYLVDVVPLLMILSALSLWWGLDCLHRHPGLQRLLLAAMVILALVSVWIGLFASFQVPGQRFESNNPDLYRMIARYFEGKP